MTEENAARRIASRRVLPMASCLYAAVWLFCGSPAFAQGASQGLLSPPIQDSAAVAGPASPVVTLGRPSPSRPPVFTRYRSRWISYGAGGAPSYPWGYFGAQPRPYHVEHAGYYGDRLQSSLRRGD